MQQCKGHQVESHVPSIDHASPHPHKGDITGRGLNPKPLNQYIYIYYIIIYIYIIIYYIYNPYNPLEC